MKEIWLAAFFRTHPVYIDCSPTMRMVAAPYKKH
jgi:hypothetical protein